MGSAIFGVLPKSLALWTNQQKETFSNTVPFVPQTVSFLVAAKLSKSLSTRCLSPRRSPNHADEFFPLLKVMREKAGVEHMISNSVGIVTINRSGDDRFKSHSVKQCFRHGFNMFGRLKPKMNL